MTIHEEGNVTDLTRYMSTVGDELYAGSVVVGSGDDFVGETYIYCEGHPESIYFDVPEESEKRNQGMVDLVRFLWQHKDC